MICPKCRGAGTIDDHFGVRVMRARKKVGLRQSDLAKLVGVRQGMISRYESGASLPNIRMAKKIAEALGTTPRKLVYPMGSKA
jgi:ribosome-binding protein aMBF1 (putative translation factor)